MPTQSKEDAFELLEQYRADYLTAARAFMATYASKGQVVTVNDLIDFGPALPAGVDPRVRGAVFRDKEVWERLGYGGSYRKTSHGRPIMRFRLARHA